ncbi:MAG: RNA 2'-phosphotransferase [Planctomycetes bacterium]|nr:RNA 2'-phosphotransferase [Planctomycetota bacterium]
METSARFRELSKTVSHALRHEPWLYELELDSGGWVDCEQLIDVLRSGSEEWANLTVDDLRAMIAGSDKVRHEISGGRIRAIYGHSVPGKFACARQAPPAQLFHGTAQHCVAQIRQDGLKPMARQYVHLSVDHETATRVALRKSKTIAILRVDAGRAHREGIAFYNASPVIWLADQIPSPYIEAT